jgi:hypothetical protein
MVEEVGDGLPEGKLQEPFSGVKMSECESGSPKMDALSTLI